MIHEVDPCMFDLPLEEYILTFDDGLYTQYIYLDELTKLNTEKFFFISTNIVADDTTKQSSEFISCSAAHEKVFKSGDKSNYMNWGQINEIDKIEKCHIGGHGHNHIHPCKDFIEDIRYMEAEFIDKLGHIPKTFCFPYNEAPGIYKAHMISKGYHIYGSFHERVDIYSI